MCMMDLVWCLMSQSFGLALTRLCRIGCLPRECVVSSVRQTSRDFRLGRVFET